MADLTIGHNIRATVYNDARAMYRASGPEAMKSVGEIEFANGVAAMAASGAFRDEEHAVRLANSTAYGLSAIVWTSDVGRAHRVAHAIDAGIVVVNATRMPTGSISPDVLSAEPQRQSGWGVEGGLGGLASYTRATGIQINV